MSDQDVIDQVAAYSQWLQRSTGLDLGRAEVTEWPSAQSGGPAELVDIEAVSGASSGTSPQRPGRIRALVVAALVVAVSVLGWGVIRLRPQTEQTVDAAASPQDPPGALFVLPRSIDSDRLINGNIIEIAEELVFRQVLVVGTADGESLRNLANVVVGPSPGNRGERSQQVQLTDGPAELIDDAVTVLARQAGADWISVMAGPGEEAYVTEIMESLVVRDDGLVDVGSDTGLSVIEAVLADDRSPSNASTSYEIVSDSDGPTITVQTGTGPTPLLNVGATGSQSTLSPAGDFLGWELSRIDSDGEWNALIWQATPNRTIAVSGHAPQDEIRAIAESLAIVDREPWQDALPGYSTGP